MGKAIAQCPCCGGTTFNQAQILWPELIQQWRLNDEEATYINRQQGLSCESCHSNLRSMTLAGALLRIFGYNGTLHEFVAAKPKASILEVNTAGHLNPFLRKLPGHKLAEYPDVDIMNMPYGDNSFDAVLHSDTMEHVPDPVRGLSEGLRILRPGGVMCYTIPVVVGRLSRRRDGKSSSFHGTPGKDDYLVQTEYGSDMWTQLMEAGFDECRLITLDYPASIAIVGVKPHRTMTGVPPRAAGMGRLRNIVPQRLRR